MGKKSAITIIACEETYRNLSTFKTIEELNMTVRKYKENFAEQLNKSIMLVLEQLHRYSVKYIGVSFRTKNHIAVSLNISRKTVQRACKVLEDLGVIKQFEMKRKSDMRQTSNAIIIVPFEENVQQDTQENKEICPAKKTTSISLKQNINKERNEPLNIDWVSSRVPKKFINYVQYFYNNAQTVEELFSVVSIQTRYLYHYSEPDRINLALNAFKQLIRNIKLGKKKIRNIFGYYFGIVKNLLDQEYWELLNESS